MSSKTNNSLQLLQKLLNDDVEMQTNTKGFKTDQLNLSPFPQLSLFMESMQLPESFDTKSKSRNPFRLPSLSMHQKYTSTKHDQVQKRNEQIKAQNQFVSELMQNQISEKLQQHIDKKSQYLDYRVKQLEDQRQKWLEKRVDHKLLVEARQRHLQERQNSQIESYSVPNSNSQSLEILRKLQNTEKFEKEKNRQLPTDRSVQLSPHLQDDTSAFLRKMQLIIQRGYEKNLKFLKRAQGIQNKHNKRNQFMIIKKKPFIGLNELKLRLNLAYINDTNNHNKEIQNQ